MEIQWQLVIFTLMICLGSGTFGVTGLLAAFGKADEIRLPALVVSLASIGIGGFASLFHVQHWERLFNGFGQLTSGITQELIAMVIVVLVMGVYFVVSRKGHTPKWAGWLALAASLLMVFAMSHSYLMPARPLWDSWMLYLYYYANFFLFGGLMVAVLFGLRDASAGIACKIAMAGGVMQLLSAVVYAIAIPKVAAKFSIVEHYFDPNNPTKEIMDPNAIFASYLGGEGALLFWGGTLVLGAIIPLVIALLANKKSGKTLATVAIIGVVCALLGGLAFRVVLYNLGFSLFVFY